MNFKLTLNLRVSLCLIRIVYFVRTKIVIEMKYLYYNVHFISYFSTIDNFVPPTIPNGKSYCPAYNDLIGDGFIFFSD